MPKRTSLSMAGLCLAVALLAGMAAVFGVFFRGDGSSATAISVRGEQFDYATNGVYRYNAQRVVAEGVGWDVFTLFCAVPAMLACLPALARGSFRGRLFALGLLGYFFYQYLEYSLTWAYGPLFLPFIAIYALSLAGIAWIAPSVGLAGLSRRFGPGFPRRGMAVLCFAMAAILLVMWLSLIIPTMGGSAVGLLKGQTTLVVQALDLGLIVPLCLFTGIAAWRARPIGYLLCSVFVVKA
ncbi:MAG TPA: hypothetical protein VFL04_06780, partial [Rectinemataceae bacterium]|nr:hypothetical protein [Rectinemataceae bacterium]